MARDLANQAYLGKLTNMAQSTAKTATGNTAKTPAKKPKKKLNLDEVLTQILACTVKHPPSKLTFSLVSRLTKVPRSTLYYYFGSSQEAMIDEAAKYGMKELLRLGFFEQDVSAKTWKEFQHERLTQVADIVARHPWAPGLYLQYRNNPGVFGNTIRKAEEAWTERTAQAWERFHGKPPGRDVVRLTGYLKIGWLWGMATDSKLWLNADDPRLSELVELIGELSTHAIELYSRRAKEDPQNTPNSKARR